MKFRYSMWDGTQEVPELAPDEILDNLTDDLMNFGDLQHALRNMLQRGVKNPQGQRNQGLRDLLQQLRQQRRQQLDKFDLSSIFDDLPEKLDEILNMENNTIDRRLDEAMGDQDQGQPGDQQQGAENQPGAPQPRGQQSPSQQGQRNQQGAQSQQGQQQEGGEGQDGQDGQPTPTSEFAELLKNIAN
jgi:hypothetical protein